LLLVVYLLITWSGGLMAPSYYDETVSMTDASIGMVLLQLIVTDTLSALAHMMEHKFSRWCWWHKRHHVIRNPSMTDAFAGHVLDTLCLILIPLFITSRLIHTNAINYMIFGSVYAVYLVLIHSSHKVPLTQYLSYVGFTTATDHQRHHIDFTTNYGHVVTVFDRVCGTYTQ
jgi:sterol desaturase/sphingolipid hydroxylase (fatty acid hydroxylase superfamily)